jgi:hypothetical protein
VRIETAAIGGPVLARDTSMVNGIGALRFSPTFGIASNQNLSLSLLQLFVCLLYD